MRILKMKNIKLYCKIATNIYNLELLKARLKNEKNFLALDVGERATLSRQAKKLIMKLNKVNSQLKRQNGILRDLKRS